MTNYHTLKNHADPGRQWLSLIADINRIRLHAMRRETQFAREILNELALELEDKPILEMLKSALLDIASGHVRKADDNLRALIAKLILRIPPVPGFRHPLHTQN